MSPMPGHANRTARTVGAVLLVSLGAGIGGSSCIRPPTPRSGVSPAVVETVDGEVDAAATAAVASVLGFAAPTSVLHDAALRAWYVADRAPALGTTGASGSVARMSDDPRGTGLVARLVDGARSGVTLRAPAGMALVGDTLWVADVDVLRGFDRRTGRSVAAVGLAPLGAASLGDVAVGPDGALYVGESGPRDVAGRTAAPRTSGRVYRVGPGRRASVALSDARLADGSRIAWDSRGGRLVLAPAAGDTLLAWRPGESDARPLLAGPGSYRGVVATPEGRLLVASDATASVYELRDGRLVAVLRGLDSVSDLAFDATNGWLAIATPARGRVAFYAVPRGDAPRP